METRDVSTYTIVTSSKQLSSSEAIAKTAEVTTLLLKSSFLTQAETQEICRKQAKDSEDNGMVKLTNCKESVDEIRLSNNGSGKNEISGLGCRNDAVDAPQSVASDCGGSSDESDDTNQDISVTEKQSLNEMNANAAQNNITIQHHSAAVVVEETLGLVTSLNADSTGATLVKDEDELRKERRKQSNRESAKRSRIRKQQEYEELQAVWKLLKAEGSRLAYDLRSLSEECVKLQDENSMIIDEIIEKFGKDAISDLVDGESTLANKTTSSDEITVSDRSRGSLPR